MKSRRDGAPGVLESLLVLPDGDRHDVVTTLTRPFLVYEPFDKSGHRLEQPLNGAARLQKSRLGCVGNDERINQDDFHGRLPPPRAPAVVVRTPSLADIDADYDAGVPRRSYDRAAQV